MKVSVQVVIEANGDAPPAVHEVTRLGRDALQPDTLGLKLAEAKGSGCGAQRRHKDVGTIVVRLGGGHLTTEETRQLERLKWFLWHGNVFRALQVIADLEEDLDLEGEIGPERRKLRKAIAEFGGYLRANAAWLRTTGSANAAGRRSRAPSPSRRSTRS